MRQLIEHLENLTESRVVKVRRPTGFVPKGKAQALQTVMHHMSNTLGFVPGPTSKRDRAMKEVAMGMLDGSLPQIEFKLVDGKVLSTGSDEHDIFHVSGDPQLTDSVSFEVPSKFEVEVEGFMPAAEIDSWMRKYFPGGGFSFNDWPKGNQQGIAHVIAVAEVVGAQKSLDGLEDEIKFEFVSEETSEPVDWSESSLGDSWDVSDISYLAKNGVKVRMKVTVNEPRIVVDLAQVEPKPDYDDMDDPW